MTESRDLAAKAGSLETATRAIGELANEFEVDPLEMKSVAFAEIAKVAVTPVANTSLAEAVRQTMDEAVLANQYAAAQKLIPLFTSIALKSKDKQLIARSNRAENELAELRKQYEAVSSAAEVLKKKPNDPAANLTVGKFECFWKDDWNTGLPKLAKSSDVKLQEAAHKDLANSDNATEQARIGDAWWLIADAESESVQLHVKLRAAQWYRRALPGLSGLARATVESRLNGLAPTVSHSEAAPQPAARPHSRLVDLIKLVDLKRDSVAGIWEVKSGLLLLKSKESPSRLEFHYEPPEEYDFQVIFARVEGGQDVALVCAAADRQFLWLMDGYGNRMGFDLVKGENMHTNPTAKPCRLENGHRYTTLIKVRKIGVQAYLNGNLVDEWRSNLADLSLPPGFDLRGKHTLGIGIINSPTLVYSAKVMEVTGVGKVLARP